MYIFPHYLIKLYFQSSKKSFQAVKSESNELYSNNYYHSEEVLKVT